MMCEEEVFERLGATHLAVQKHRLMVRRPAEAPLVPEVDGLHLPAELPLHMPKVGPPHGGARHAVADDVHEQAPVEAQALGRREGADRRHLAGRAGE